MKSRNNWDEVSTNYCINIKLQCEGMSEMFLHNQNKYQKLSERIKLASGIFGAIIAAIGLITISNLSMIINIIIAILGCFVTILSVFSSVWKVDENLTSSYAAYTNFDHIVAEIKFQFTLKPNERNDCNEFKKYILEKYHATKAGAPVVTEALKSYLKNKSGISYNALYENNEIVENTDSNSSDIVIVSIPQSSEIIKNKDKDNDIARIKSEVLERIDVTSVRDRCNSEPLHLKKHPKLLCPPNSPSAIQLGVRHFEHDTPARVRLFVDTPPIDEHHLINIHNHLDVHNSLENVRANDSPVHFSTETTL